MPDGLGTYEAWNRAIADHALYGLARGMPAYLSFDDRAADLIGGGLADFLNAVRRRCLYGGRANVGNLPPQPDGLPVGVAFLAAMVLAAGRMKDDDAGTEMAYFVRLGEVLGTQADRCGLSPAGIEEPLWNQWNQYVARQGYLPTAAPGEGPRKYMDYPIGQTVLRDADRGRLAKRMADRHISTGLDTAQLGYWLATQGWPRDMAAGFHHPDPDRRSAFVRAAYAVYQAWASKGPATSSGGRGVAAGRSLEGGLLRSVDIRGAVTYLLMPRQVERFEPKPLSLVGPPVIRLKPLRVGGKLKDGFYQPPCEQAPFFAAATRRPVGGDDRIDSLLFPARRFWVLTRDPNDPDDGPFGTWSDHVEVGQRFVVLCPAGSPLVAEMRRLRDARATTGVRLLDWREEKVGVHEFVDCMVLSYELKFADMPDSRELVAAMAPRSGASVSLGGGLRDPNQGVWIEGHPPTVTAHGFAAGGITLRLSRAGDPRPLLAPIVTKSQTDHALPADLTPGTYVVTADAPGDQAKRMFVLVPWVDVTPSPDPQRFDYRHDPARTAGLRLCGARLAADVHYDQPEASDA
jgi:hypothetical protein